MKKLREIAAETMDALVTDLRKGARGAARKSS